MPPTRDVLIPLLSLLEQRVGLRLQSSATQTLAAFDAMAHALNIGADELLERLSNDLALLEELATQLTIPETHFFRIGPQIKALIQTLLPDLARRVVGTRTVQMWSAGCSTGEEAYTLAILAAQTRSLRGEVSILGTDLHPASLNAARRGLYGAWSFRDTPKAVRDTYFEEIPYDRSSILSREQSSTLPREHTREQTREHSTKWQIAPHLRQMVRFEALNLLSADWSQLERFDLILCRNVMIYFSNLTAQHLIERLAAQLQPGGWLMLGPSDPPPLPSTLERCGLSVRFESEAIVYQKQLTEVSLPRSASPSVPTLELPVLAASMSSFEAAMPPEPRVLSHDAVVTVADFEQQLQLGMDALEISDYPVALAALRRAVYLEPQSALAQFLLAQTLLDSLQPDRARVAVRQAQRLLLLGNSNPMSELHRAVTALSVMLGES